MGKVLVEADEALLEEARKLTGAASSEEAVEAALKVLLGRQSGRNAGGRGDTASSRETTAVSLTELVGKVRFYEGFDPRKLRFSRYDPD